VRYIEEQIKAANRNVTQAADKMGLQRSNLYRKMKQLGMKQPD
jgi:Nif-specific regulatory protein